jgi:Arc/MetJ-type ribon-helix-helix transcriptional regulator
MTSIPADIQTLIDQEMQLGDYANEVDVLLHALKALRSERESNLLNNHDDEVLASIRRGLNESRQGLGKSVDEFDRDFRARHNLGADL